MKGLLILALVAGALLLGNFGVPVDATNYHAAAELHRSMARYRQVLEQEDAIAPMRNLLQVDEKIKDELHSGGDVDSIDPDPEKQPDEFQLGLDVVRKNEPVEENSDEEPTNNAEQQQVDEKIKEDDLYEDITNEANLVETENKFHLEQDMVETQIRKVEDISNENPKQEEHQQQVEEKVEVDRDLAGEENTIAKDPEKHVDELQQGRDMVEENGLEEDNPNENPEYEGIEEHQQVLLDEKSQDDEVTSKDPKSEKPVKPVKQNQLGRDVVEKQHPLEEKLSENQELENSVEKPHIEEKVDDQETTSEVDTTDLDTEKPVKDDQLGQDVVERQEPAKENSRESQTDENAKDQQPGEEEDMKSNEETVEEAVVEKPTEENTAENLELEQQQQEDSENDEELEQKETEGQQHKEEQKGGEEGNKTEEKELFVFPEPYLLGPPIKDWDEQRAEWLERNPHMKPTNGKPKVLIVTGSQPEPCRSTRGDYFHIQSLKLKMDYARMHNYEIYYNFAWLDPLFGGWWVKLPTVRKLMLTHPEIEWFFWIDSDAVFTDMIFELPFHTYEGYNMIMWGWEYGVYEKKLWTAFNAGVFIIRNCQWSLDLIDKWSPMGPEGPVRDEYGKILTAFLTGRDHFDYFPADDQSALVYLMLTDEAVKSKVKLVQHAEYMISGWWIDTLPLYNASIEKYHPGLGNYRYPFITHFTGCSPCRGDQESDDYGKCMEGFQTAYNFADNQVLAFMGFQHESLSSPEVTRIRNETGQPLEFVGINPWEERIAQVAAEGTSGFS